MRKIISFDLYAEKAFFKKPDINDKLYLTYNTLHKPALLGIMGAILGLSGYQTNSVLPDYYIKLKHVPVAIKPIGADCENGNFIKTIISYNNTTGLASDEKGGNLIVSEQTIINPKFRIYISLDLDVKMEALLFDRISNQQSEYIPYLGKNDYMAYWNMDEVNVYDHKAFIPKDDFRISSLFLKDKPLVDSIVEHKTKRRSNVSFLNGTFMFFENLPVELDEYLFQYNYKDFTYTDWMISKDSNLSSLFEVGKDIIQLN